MMANLDQQFEYLCRATQARGTAANQFMGRCPAHEDNTASLSLRLTQERILLNCFAGCSFDSVIQNLNIERNDLFFENSFMKNNENLARIAIERKKYELNLKEVKPWYLYEESF